MQNNFARRSVNVLCNEYIALGLKLLKDPIRMSRYVSLFDFSSKAFF